MNTHKFLSTPRIVRLSLVAILVVGLANIAAAPAVPNATNLTASLSNIAGTVDVQNGAQNPFNPVNDGFTLKTLETLQTKIQSRVLLDMSTGSLIQLGPTTIFSLASQQTATSGGLLSTIELKIGSLWSILQGGSMQVNTPGGLAAVRGSYMSVEVVTGSNSTNTVTVTCLEGNCSFTDSAGVVALTTGQKIVSNNPNVLPAVQTMNKADVQSWLTNNPELASLNTEISTLLASPAASVSTTAKPTVIYQNQYSTRPHVKKQKTSTPKSTPAPAQNPDPDDGNNPNLND